MVWLVDWFGLFFFACLLFLKISCILYFLKQFTKYMKVGFQVQEISLFSA